MATACELTELHVWTVDNASLRTKLKKCQGAQFRAGQSRQTKDLKYCQLLNTCDEHKIKPSYVIVGNHPVMSRRSRIMRWNRRLWMLWKGSWMLPHRNWPSRGRKQRRNSRIISVGKDSKPICESLAKDHEQTQYCSDSPVNAQEITCHPDCWGWCSDWQL